MNNYSQLFLKEKSILLFKILVVASCLNVATTMITKVLKND